MAQVLCEKRLGALIDSLGARRLAELASEFATRLDGLLAAVGCDASEPDDLIRLSHQIRGSAGALGMSRLSAELERLELSLTQLQPGAADRVRRVRAAHAVAQDALAHALAAHGEGHANRRSSR
jgi:HPt (histidine-containing phosphotransfer) domain-containing protein